MRIFCQILLIFMVVVTICVCIIKPNGHKSVFMYNSDYKITSEEVNVITKDDVTVHNIPISQQDMAITDTTVQNTEVSFKNNVTAHANLSVKPQSVTGATSNIAMSTPPATVQSVKTQNIKTEAVKVKPAYQRQEQIRQQAHTPAITDVLTQEEEEIVWNAWRSNIQNKIMQDVKLPVLPNGIIFRFSFSVDKYGKISNLRAWSTTSEYTPYAIRYILPVIRSYQGKEILNFPQGSARTVTNVQGGWKISTVERYSTPQDYNDIESVTK